MDVRIAAAAARPAADVLYEQTLFGITQEFLLTSLNLHFSRFVSIS